jgi:N-acetylmuramoyl-L-alanine amidase
VEAGPEPGAVYRVQVGAFANRDNASELVARLLADGFAPYMVRERELYKVRVGAFRDRSRAEELSERLRAKGYPVVIVR